MILLLQSLVLLWFFFWCDGIFLLLFDLILLAVVSAITEEELQVSSDVWYMNEDDASVLPTMTDIHAGTEVRGGGATAEQMDAVLLAAFASSMMS